MAPTRFDLTVAPVGEGVWVAHLQGELDLSSSPGLADRLVVAPDTVVVVDLWELAFLDSSGISELIVARKRLDAVGGRLLLSRPSENLSRLLEIVGLTDWLVDWEPGWSD